jgi:hypothetical protein
MKRGMKIDSKQCAYYSVLHANPLRPTTQQESYKGKEIHEIETHHNSKPHSTFKMPSLPQYFATQNIIRIQRTKQVHIKPSL